MGAGERTEEDCSVVTLPHAPHRELPGSPAWEWPWGWSQDVEWMS